MANVNVSAYAMIYPRLARKAREWISVAAHHAALTAAVAWLLGAVASLIMLRTEMQRPGAIALQSWIELAVLLVQPFLVGLLVYLTLRFAAYQERTERAARGIAAEANRRSRELEILHQIGIAVTSTLDLDQIMRLVYECVGPVLAASTFFIALYDEARRQLDFEFLVDDGVVSPKFSQPIDPETSLSGWIIEHRKPLLIPDLQKPGASPVPAGVIGSPSRSWMGIPLILQDHLIGIMSVQSYEPDKFDDGNLYLLSAAAPQISMVIENARLFAQTRARAEEMSAVNEITRAINSTLDLGQVLQLFLSHAAALFNVEAGSLLLLDPITNELVFEVVHGGAGESLLHKRMRSNEGIVGWVTQHNLPLLVPDVRQDARWYKDFDRDTQFVTRSILAVPIRVEERAIGAIEIMNRRDGKPFNASDEKLLGMFGASAGIAIENARLHRQTEKRLAEVTTLNLIANQLATSLDLDEILNSIVNRLKPMFNATSCTVHLLDEENQVLRLAANSTPSPAHVGPTIRLGEGIVGRVAAEGSLMYIACAQAMPPDAAPHPEIESILTVPLSSRDRVLGTLSLWSALPQAFSEDDQRLLTTVAAQIATAVENAQLYKDLSLRAAHLKQAYDDLRELDRLKTEFVQNVSHELRSPLTFIKGYVELIRNDTLGAVSDKVHEALDIIAGKTNVLVRMVNDILALQQAEADSLRIGTVSLGSVAQEAVRQAAPAAQAAGVQLKTEIGSELPTLLGDPERLGRVFDNLLHNACKFSPEGGEVCVRVYEKGDQLQAEVQDHGIGIPSDHLDKVFERFYQVDGSATRRFGGTGLGLAIVKQIIEAHHGHVWVISVPGQGSTFYFRLPKKP